MTNPAQYLIHEDQLRTIKTIKDVLDDGSFYTMDYRSDHRLDDVIAYSAGNMEEFYAAMQKYLVEERLPIPPVGAGCAAFKVRNKAGHVLVGRNFDYKHTPNTMLIRVSPSAGYRNFGMCDLCFADFEQGQINDGKTDITKAIMFPYVTMDGINEKGVFICILQLKNAETYQNSGKKKMLTTVAVRAALDKAASVREVVDIFASHDIQTCLPGNDFHFFVADASGGSAVIEYFKGKMNVIGTDHVTNFFLSPGARRRGGGKGRYDVLGSLIDYREGCIEKEDVMNMLRLISQPSGQKGTNYTLWSAVYDLTAGEVELAIDQKYDRVLRYSLRKF